MPLCYNESDCLDRFIPAMGKKRIYLWIQDDGDLNCNIFSLPWREIWSESADKALKREIQSYQSNTGLWPVERQVLPVVRDPDETITGSFSYDRILPVYFLHGVEGSEEDFREMPPRRRRNIRERMLERLAEIRQGTFVIAGGSNAKNWLNSLGDILDEAFLPDVKSIDLLLISDKMPEFDHGLLEKRKQDVYLWPGTTEDFLKRIMEVKSSAPGLDHEHQIKVGTDVIGIDDLLVGMTRRIDEDYYLIEVADLEEPAVINDKLLHSFMGEPDPCWPGFAAGFAFERSYYPLASSSLRKKLQQQGLMEAGDSGTEWFLRELVEHSLELSSRDFGRNITVTLPSEPGSGATTLLWSTAYKLAREGYPVLILRPGTREIDFNALASFLTGITRRYRDRSKDEDGRSLRKEVPVLLVFDVEHQAIALTREIANQLRNDGRFCVVLRAIEPVPEVEANDWRSELDKAYRRARGTEICCDTLKADVDKEETRSIARHFIDISSRNHLSLDLPAEEEWDEYQLQQAILIPGIQGGQEAESLFWVCLHFFLLKQIKVSDRLADQLENKMKEVRREHPELACYIYSTAVTTNFRLALPTRILAHAYSVINWVELSENINIAERMIPHLTRDYGSGDEEFLRFRHTQFARIVLRELNRALETEQIGFFLPPSHLNYPVEWLHHLICSLEPGIEVHRQFGKLVATQVLKLEGKRRELLSYSESLLDTFSQFPLHFIQQNQTILQANAITLSKSVSGNHELSHEDIRKRYAEAEGKMYTALKLVDSDNILDEDPRVLKTTLGNIYESWSRKELEWQNYEEAKELAQKATMYYKDVFKDWPDNAYARYGYALLLFNRYMSRLESDSQENMDDLEEALECLDVAPGYDFEDQWEIQRFRILEQISSAKAKGRLEELMNQGMEIGYVLQARSILQAPDQWNDECIDQAVPLLEFAESCSHRANNPIARISLLYRVVSFHSQRRWDIAYRYRLLNRLQNNAYHFTNRMLYEFAVICYQLDRQDEGERLFSVMRRGQRYLQLNLEKHEYWREQPEEKGESPVRMCTMKIESVDSAFNGWVRVNGIKRLVPFNPSHPWRGKPVKNMTTACTVRFRQSGPQAVPPDFAREV